MCSGTASFPVSCNRAAASIAFNVGSSVDAQLTRQANRVRLHPTHVAVRHVIFRVDRHRERLDRGQVQAIHLRHVPVGVLDPPERRTQRQMKDGDHWQDHRDGGEARSAESAG